MNHYSSLPSPITISSLTPLTQYMVFRRLDLGLLGLLGDRCLFDDFIGQEFLVVQVTEVNVEPDGLNNEGDGRGSPEPDL
jgi:hypothetical protein